MAEVRNGDEVRRMRTVLVLLGITSLAGFSVPIFAAHAPAPAGVAVGHVSGFRVSNVSFALDEARPDRVRRVSFALAPPTATTVRVALGGERALCGVRAGQAVCAFAGGAPRLDAISSLTVLAAS
jgi:hypothetical protein